MALDIKLHPKQLLALNTPATEVLYGGAVGGGKALDVNTPILTTCGWKTMASLVVGDKVFDEHGQPCNVVAKSKVDKVSATYEVEFDGIKSKVIACDGRHQWSTLSRTNRLNRVTEHTPKTTNEIRHSIKAEHGKRNNHTIQVTKPVQLGERVLDIDPYILGAFLGGGVYARKAKKGMVITSRCASTTTNLTKYKDGKYYDKEDWKALLKSVGLYGVKPRDLFIPIDYQLGSITQRTDLLKGMLDVRGTVYSDSYRYKRSAGQVEMYTDGQQLCKDVHFMLLSLGQKSLMYAREDSRRPTCAWRVRVFADMILFNSKDKSMQQRKSMGSIRTARQRHYISDVRKVEKRAMQCIQVDSDSSCYLSGEYLIPTHNSYLMRIASIVWAMEVPGIQIYLFRLTQKELDDNHMVGSGGYYTLLLDAVHSKYVKINSSKNIIQFRNGKHNGFMGGSIIHLCHCQHEDDKYLYKGAEMDVLMIDEATHFTRTKYEYLRTRVRRPKDNPLPDAVIKKYGAKYFPRILLGTNPGGISHNFWRREFVKIAEPMSIVQMPNTKGGMLRQFIPAQLSDNPSIDKEEYEGKVMGVGNEATVRMLLDGDWDAVAGGMFDDVWDADVHMIPPFEIPFSWYCDRSFDWGYTDPFSVGWWAQSDGSSVKLADTTKDGVVVKGETVVFPKGTLFRIAEWYGWTGEENIGIGLTAYEIGQGISKMERTNAVLKNIERIVPGPGDHQVWNSSPKQDSSYRSLIHELNAGYYGNDNYMLFDIFTKADQTAGSRPRGWDILRTHLKNSVNYPKIDRPCLFIFNTCETPNRIIPTLIRHDKKIEDIADHQEDHVADEMRYRIQHAVHQTKRIPTRMG